jgi:hypothetical protein
VTVSAQTTPVQTASNERSALLDEKQMNTLMARGRDYTGLLKTLPGVVPNSDPAVLQQQSSPNAVNGVRAAHSPRRRSMAWLVTIHRAQIPHLLRSAWMPSPR